MKSDKNFSVYIHRKASTGDIFYVGKGRPKRPHSVHNRSQFWNNVVNKHGFTHHIVRSGMGDPCACTLEKILISALKERGIRLCNSTKGGVGGPGSKPGLGSPWFGVQKEMHPFYGRRHTDEAKQRMSKALKGKPKCQKWREAYRTGEKVRATPAPYHFSPEGKANVARAAKIHSQKRIDRTLLIFRHPEHGEVIRCQYDMAAEFGISRGNLCWVIKGKLRQTKGWTFHGLAAPEDDQPANLASDDKVVKLRRYG